MLFKTHVKRKLFRQGPHVDSLLIGYLEAPSGARWSKLRCETGRLNLQREDEIWHTCCLLVCSCCSVMNLSTTYFHFSTHTSPSVHVRVGWASRVRDAWHFSLQVTRRQLSKLLVQIAVPTRMRIWELSGCIPQVRKHQSNLKSQNLACNLPVSPEKKNERNPWISFNISNIASFVYSLNVHFVIV